MKMSRRISALLLSLVLCFTMASVALASNTLDVSFSVELDKTTIQTSESDQTVTMTVKLSKAADMDSMEYWVTCPEKFSVAEPVSEILTGGSWDDKELHESWMTLGYSDVTGVEELATIVYTIPGGTEAGEYELGVYDIQLSSNCEYWEENGSASVTLIIEDVPEPPETGYTASLSTDDTAVTVGEAVAVAVNATHESDSQFAAAEVVLSYDSDKLTFVSVKDVDKTQVDTSKTGVVRFADYGEDKDLGDGVYTVNFTAKAAGTAAVTLSSAAFSEKQNASQEDLSAATIGTAEVAIEISQAYSVTLPSESYIHGASSVEKGQSYSLTVDDYAYYNYTVSAKMGGESASVTADGNGGYTVANVTGDLVFSVSRTAKQYAVTFAGTGITLPSNGMATYGTDYTFNLPVEEHYTISVDSAKYQGGGDVAYAVSNGKVTVAGANITDAITFTLKKVQADTTVTVEGTAASDVTYEPYATPGQAYTLTVTKNAAYDYTVSAKLNGTDVAVVNNNDGTYTIAASNVKAGSLVFTVNKTIVPDISVSKYLQLDGTMLWLVKMPVDELEGQVYTCKGETMFRSEAYGAYCTLILSETEPAITADDLAIVTGEAVAIAGFDVNKSGKLDANDAQFVYNMYKPLYNEITAEVTVEKLLLADVNGDGTVNVSDVAAIVNQIISK